LQSPGPQRESGASGRGRGRARSPG
jgi:hypothetical protein